MNKLLVFVGFILMTISPSFSQENIFGNAFVPRLSLGEPTPNPCYSNEGASIAYSALTSFSSSIIFFDSEGKKVLDYQNLQNTKGEITIAGGQLQPGKYRYVLFVNERIVFTQRMEVLAAGNVMEMSE